MAAPRPHGLFCRPCGILPVAIDSGSWQASALIDVRLRHPAQRDVWLALSVAAGRRRGSPGAVRDFPGTIRAQGLDPFDYILRPDHPEAVAPDHRSSYFHLRAGPLFTGERRVPVQMVSIGLDSLVWKFQLFLLSGTWDRPPIHRYAGPAHAPAEDVAGSRISDVLRRQLCRHGY